LARLFPDSAEGGFLARGLVKASMRDDPQTDHSGIRRSDSFSVYLTEMYLGPIEQAEAHYSAAGRNW
jgi:hypothetical protein